MKAMDHGQKLLARILRTRRVRLALSFVLCISVIGFLLFVYTHSLSPVQMMQPATWNVPAVATVDESVQSIPMGWATAITATDNQGRDTRGILKGYGIAISVSPAGSGSNRWQRIIPTEVTPMVYEGSLQREGLARVGIQLEASSVESDWMRRSDLDQWWRIWEEENPGVAEHKKQVIIGKGFRITSGHHLAGPGVEFEATPVLPDLLLDATESSNSWRVGNNFLSSHQRGPCYSWGVVGYTTIVLPWRVRTDVPGVMHSQGITMIVIPEASALDLGDQLWYEDCWFGGRAFVSPTFGPFHKSGTTAISKSLNTRDNGS